MSCPKQYVAWVVLCLSIIKITIRQCAVGRKESINLSTICLYWYNGHTVAVFNIVQTFSGEQTQGHDCRRGSTVIIYYSSETITIHPRRPNTPRANHNHNGSPFGVVRILGVPACPSVSKVFSGVAIKCPDQFHQRQ